MGCYVRYDEEKGPDDGKEAVEVCRCGKSGPGLARRRHEGLHIRLYLLRVWMLLLSLLLLFCACLIALQKGQRCCETHE